MSPIFQFHVSVVLCSYALCNLIHSSYFVYCYMDRRYAIYYAQCFIRHCALGFGCGCDVCVRVVCVCGLCKLCYACVVFGACVVCVCGACMACGVCVGAWCV